MATKPTVVYVGDPMCSWCWGLAPTVEQIASRSDLDLRVIVGGLRPGPSAAPLDDRMRTTLRHHWDKVAEASGQPFSDTALERENWVYNTELPAIAVTTMRSVAKPETLRFFTRLQRAFYADGIDITDHSEYPELLSDFGVETREFMNELGTETARTRAWDDFAEARELGVAGFPTVLLEIEGSTQVLSRGFAPSDHFDNQLTYWVESRQPDSASIGTCSVDRVC